MWVETEKKELTNNGNSWRVGFENRSTHHIR